MIVYTYLTKVICRKCKVSHRTLGIGIDIFAYHLEASLRDAKVAMVSFWKSTARQVAIVAMPETSLAAKFHADADRGEDGTALSTRMLGAAAQFHSDFESESSWFVVLKARSEGFLGSVLNASWVHLGRFWHLTIVAVVVVLVGWCWWCWWCYWWWWKAGRQTDFVLRRFCPPRTLSSVFKKADEVDWA